MWTCDCDKNGKFSHQLFNLKPTTVNSDDTCTRCGNYAVWDCGNKRAKAGTHTDKKVTLFNLTDGSSTKYNDLKQASIAAGYSTAYTVSDRFKSGKNKSMFSKDKNVMLVLGHHDELPEEELERYLPRTVYAFDYESGEFLDSAPIKKLSKKLKISVETIRHNLRRGTDCAGKKYIFSYNKDFDVVKYRKAVEIPEGFSEVKWRQDVISYDDNELGVDYKEDTYGTWKELLYS